jgi:hypothetical protein
MTSRFARWILLLLGSVSLLADAHETAGRDDLKRALARLQVVTHEYFDHPRSAKNQAYIEQVHTRIRELAKAAPEDRRLAQVIFRRGLSSNELYAMSREFQLAVHEAELTFLSPEKDFESSIPMQIFWRKNDSSEPIIDRWIADHRAAFTVRAAELRKDPNSQAARLARYFDDLAKKGKPVLVSMGVTAKVDMLRLVSEEPDVFAVVMDPSPDTVRRIDEMRDRMSGQTAIQDVPQI